MAETGRAEKMHRRTRDAPMSRRSSMDLLFIMQRHAVFAIDPDSADHISDIIFAQQTIQDMDEVKKYELLDDYHSGYDPSRGKQQRPAPKLRKAMAEAREKWAEILRDEDLVDVRVIVFPCGTKDFEHIYPPVDLDEHPFGNQLERFQGLKSLLVEEGGGMPYRLKPRARNQPNMEVDLVISRESLERIATPYMQMVLNFEIYTITAPAPHKAGNMHRPGTECLRRDGVSAHLNMELLARIIRQRSSSVQLAVREAPKQPWNFPFSAGSRLRVQHEWSGEGRPFSKDIFELGSNNDWVKRDFEARTAQINEWVAAKEQREMALQTTVPGEEFDRVQGLCDTYTADGNPEWYETNLGGNVLIDYREAMRATNAETIKYHRALENWRALGAQDPRNLETIEFYRQVMEGQLIVLERAKQHCATISQGLPLTAPKKKVMKWEPPPRESHNVVQREIQDEIDQAPGRAALSEDEGETIFHQELAEPGHTPIPEVRGQKMYKPTSRPSAGGAPTRQISDSGAITREDRRTSKTTTRGSTHDTVQLEPYRQSTNLASESRAATSVRRQDAAPVLKAPPTDIKAARYTPACGPDSVLRKIPRQVSFNLPQDDMASSTEQTWSQGNHRKDRSSQGKENDPASPPIVQPAGSMKRQGSVSLRRVPSLVHNDGEPFKFPMVSEHFPPAIFPATPKDFKVRSAGYRKDQNNACQALKLAVDKDDVINHGSPQGLFPALRRMVSGITGGIG